jgi:potassium-dependent mechanosensitive channel
MRQIHTVGISYDDDRELAMRLIGEILTEEPLVLEEPPPAVHLWDYGDSSVIFRFQYHIDIRDGMCGVRIRSRLLLEIGRRFAAHGISFPFPRRDVMLALAPEDRRALGGIGRADAL